MKNLRTFFFRAMLLLLVSGAAGCFPPGENRQDEERDPHFQRGRDLVNSQEFPAAVAEFEKALETNPHSAAAHFELGWLYESHILVSETKVNDFAAAIYHYQRFLHLAPDSPRAPNVRDRIRGCKLELAGTEYPLPNSQNLQQQIIALTDENRLLKQHLDEAHAHLAAAAAAAPAATPAPSPLPSRPAAAPAVVKPNPNPPATMALARADNVNLTVVQNSSPTSAPPVAAHARLYVIQSGDSISGIARRYGLKTSAILALNTKVSPTRLRPGQSLNLP